MKLIESIALWGVRFLSWQRGLEGFMCIVGVAWSVGMLVSPDTLAQSFPSPERFAMSSQILACILLSSCLIGYVAMAQDVRFIRKQTSVFAFVCWGLRAVFVLKVHPHPWHIFAIYACFALAELSIYLRIHAGLDLRENQIGILNRRNTGEHDDRGD